MGGSYSNLIVKMNIWRVSMCLCPQRDTNSLLSDDYLLLHISILLEVLCKTDFTNLSLNQRFAIQLDSFCEIQTHGNLMSIRFLSVFLMKIETSKLSSGSCSKCRVRSYFLACSPSTIFKAITCCKINALYRDVPEKRMSPDNEVMSVMSSQA